MLEIRNIIEPEFSDVLKLNDGEVQQTSPMDLDKLRSLVRMSSYCKVAVSGKQIVAFLIALRENAPYENENYLWFASRFQKFLYVDRIVVSSNFGGRGVGSQLYVDLFAFAKAQSVGVITCEYNINPPNHASRAFHDKFGFKALGTQWAAGGAKQVSLQAAEC